MTPSAVGNYEREVSHPREEVLYRLFDVLECQPNELFADCYTDNSKESEMLEKYRALDSFGRELVETCADIEYRRCTGGVVSAIAARGGTAPTMLVIKKRKGAGSVRDLPDYDGGR